jgi:hypothetical protein
LSRLPLAFASFLSHLLTYLLSYLFDPSPISLARPFFLVPTPDIYIRACRTLHTMSTERAKGCWRGLNPDKQIEVALRDRLIRRLGGIRGKRIGGVTNNLTEAVNYLFHHTTLLSRACGGHGKGPF